MKEIVLTQGKVALVDDEDFERLSQWKWHFTKLGYAVRHHGVYMHREILGVPKGTYVDHVNGFRLDNRKANLRACTNSQNMRNRPKTVRNKSGYKGVFVAQQGKWGACIQIDGRQKHLGFHDTREQAAEAYNKAALELHGEFAVLNQVRY